jgi:carbamoyl-phosphate synthase large subunit
VIVTDVNELSPAVHRADRAYEVPLASDPRYVDALLEICRAENIRLLVPTIDDELPTIAGARARFAAAGTRVSVSPRATTEICNDKHLTSRHLRASGVAAAASWLPGELPAGLGTPLFVKPRHGRGSIGAFAARSQRELEFFLSYVPDPIVQEYLQGPEFTIDMFCDGAGRPIAIVPRERAVIRAGVTDRGRTVRDPALIGLAASCASALVFHGAVNIQCRILNGRPHVFEINPRFSGGIPLTIAAGADFPLLALQEARGRRLEPAIGDFTDGLWMTSYEEAIFLEAARPSALLPLPSAVASVA